MKLYSELINESKNMWKVIDGKLHREFEFNNFNDAISFINKVATLSEEENHHPEIRNLYNKVEIILCTHDKGNVITDKDKQLANKIDRCFKLGN
jgi:4a-hydroxytetrahydrobiopterin dehydratase